jgi:hypothetical protein
MKGVKGTKTDWAFSATAQSRQLRKPFKLRAEPSFPLTTAMVGAVGAQVDVESRPMTRSNAASKSSKSKMHLQDRHLRTTQPIEESTHGEVMLPIRVINVLWFILFPEISPVMRGRANYAAPLG